MPSPLTARLSLRFQHWLWLGFAAIIGLMLAVSVIGIQRVNNIDTSLTQINDINSVKQRHAIDFRGSVHDRAVALRDAVMLTTNSDVAAQLALIEELARNYQATEVALERIFTEQEASITPAEREAYAQIRQTAETTQSAVEDVIAFRTNNQLAAARLVLFEDAAPGFRQWLADINVLIDLQEAMNSAETAQARDITGSFQASMLGLVGVAILISLVIAALPGRWLKRTLGADPGDVRKRVEIIGAGNFRSGTQQYPENSIMQALDDMNAKLSETVNRVRQASYEVESDSEHISYNCEELLGRVDQQAAMLTETASAMEQLGSTVAHNADRASEVDHQARDAATLAGEGGNVVREVATSMQTLNSRSEEVVSIVSLIDSIAFQTNILALNASVEAARAGEQGRGFAVVAQEVRSLATRSADASKQISSLIDANLRQVEESVALAGQASDKTRAAIEAIKRVTQLVSEISQAGVEQSRAVQEVGNAVSEMDNVTQQNTQLVKQTAETGIVLLGRSSQLGDAISEFDLDDETLLPRARTSLERAQEASLTSPSHTSPVIPA